MNPRERTLLTVLFVLLGVLGTGAVFYFFFYQEYADLSSQVAADSDKLAEKKKALKDAEDERDRLLTSSPHLKDWQLLSLPSLPPTKNGAKHTPEETNKHIAAVQREYQDNLEASLRKHKFTAFDVKPGTPDTKTPDGKGGGAAAKDKIPVYTRLPFTVKASATYASIVEMLKDFYNEPLLQEVRSLSISKPQTARQPDALAQPGGGRGGPGGAGGRVPGGAGPNGIVPGGGQVPGGRVRAAPVAEADPGADPDDGADVVPGRGAPGVVAPGGGPRGGRGGPGGRSEAATLLDVTMTVEVLMVTGAESRTSLLPSKIKPGEESVLARTVPERNYSKDMTARDPFSGKPPPPPTPQREGTDDELPPGGKDILKFVKLTSIYYNTDRGRKCWYATFYDQGNGPPESWVNFGPENSWLLKADLVVPGPNGSRLFEGKCVYLNASKLVLQDKAGKYYLMHVGDFLLPSLENPLAPDALKEYGLTPKKVAVAP